MTEHDVISAFVDDEPFEPQALVEALSAPEGREILIDILALRHLTALEVVPLPVRPVVGARWSTTRLLAAAAVLALALTGGYQLGLREAPNQAPPTPTLVVTGDDVWREIGNGGTP
jgi:hypothetical protein